MFLGNRISLAPRIWKLRSINLYRYKHPFVHRACRSTRDCRDFVHLAQHTTSRTLSIWSPTKEQYWIHIEEAPEALNLRTEALEVFQTSLFCTQSPCRNNGQENWSPWALRFWASQNWLKSGCEYKVGEGIAQHYNKKKADRDEAKVFYWQKILEPLDKYERMMERPYLQVTKNPHIVFHVLRNPPSENKLTDE